MENTGFKFGFKQKTIGRKTEQLGRIGGQARCNGLNISQIISRMIL